MWLPQRPKLCIRIRYKKSFWMLILIQEYALELPLSLLRIVISPTVMIHNVLNISRAPRHVLKGFSKFGIFSRIFGFWARIWYTLELQNHHLGSWPYKSKSLVGYMRYILYVRGNYCNVRWFQIHFWKLFRFGCFYFASWYTLQPSEGSLGRKYAMEVMLGVTDAEYDT